MRIAIANISNRRIGGVETYLNTVIPGLAKQGHQIAFIHEFAEPLGRDEISLPEMSSRWCVAELGKDRSLELLRSWKPDLIYAHKYSDPDLEKKIQTVAPSVFFIHDYYGTCISGTKTFRQPEVKPCNRQFGRACLFNYFPRHCGGLNPVTMVKLYILQSERLSSLLKYDSVVTHSKHMMNELIKHGLEVRRIYSFPYYVKSQKITERKVEPTIISETKINIPSSPVSSGFRHLVFSGRMEFLKGGHVLLDALPEVLAGLGKPVRVTFAGDGRERARLEQQASRLRQSHTELQVEFTGWLDRERMDRVLAEADLLVVPSLWPEPFGLVGPEAGLRGVPAAAFAVGGIPDWLEDGVNGALAAGDPPTVGGLAQAIIRCLRDPEEHARLRQGAIETAGQFNLMTHLNALLEVFEQTIERRHSAN